MAELLDELLVEVLDAFLDEVFVELLGRRFRVPFAVVDFLASFSSLPGQLKFGQSFHGPRFVVTITSGAPQYSQTSSVAVS